MTEVLEAVGDGMYLLILGPFVFMGRGQWFFNYF